MREAPGGGPTSNPCSAVTTHLTLFGNGRPTVLFSNNSPDQAMFVSGAPDILGPSPLSWEGAHAGMLVLWQEAT